MIGIGLLTLAPRISGGSETYARELVRALARVGKLEYRVFVPRIAADAGDGLESRVSSSYRASFSTAGRLVAMGLAAAFPGRLQRELGAQGLEAVHFPLTIALPRRLGVPSCVTLHDLQHLDLPRFFSRAERDFRKIAWHPSIRNAQLVIVPSEFVRTGAVERLGLDPARIRVIAHGIDHDLFRPGPEEREPFLLFPANNWPHKNHERLFQAFALLRRERPELRLVLTGSGHERRRLPDGVEALGHVSREELASLFGRAACLVFPSLYEGFGQPPLEAMASGCPVAVSRVASLPEVCGEATRYFDPTEPEEIAAVVSEALDRPDRMREKGLERARAFTWERCAREHERVYEELISSAPSSSAS
jgi:glycosyltransferase involved in cell wall biosynthesis